MPTAEQAFVDCTLAAYNKIIPPKNSNKKEPCLPVPDETATVIFISGMLRAALPAHCNQLMQLIRATCSVRKPRCGEANKLLSAFTNGLLSYVYVYSAGNPFFSATEAVCTAFTSVRRHTGYFIAMTGGIHQETTLLISGNAATNT